MRRILALAASAAMVILLSAGGSAQSGVGSIEITIFPGNGIRLTQNSPFYSRVMVQNREVHLLDVSAWAIPIPPGSMSDWHFFVNGTRHVATTIPGPYFGVATQLEVPPRPVLSQFTILVELYHRPTRRIVARTQVAVWDLRDNPLEPVWSERTLRSELGVQVTGRGFDALEGAHGATLPWPDAQAFDERLDNLPRISGTPMHLDNQPRSGADLACVPLNELPNAFQSTGAFVAAFAEASASYAAYLLAQAAGPAGEAAAALNCVREPPLPRRFEVCVGTIAGPVTDVDIDRVSVVDLALAGDRLRADVTLSGVHAEVEGQLRNLVVRWAQHPGLCAVVPSAALDDDTVNADPDLNDWATCRGLRATAATASTLESTDPFLVGARSPTFGLGTGQEQVVVNQVEEASFEVAGTLTVDPNVAACGHPAIVSSTARFLHTYRDKVAEAASLAWNEGMPATQQAEALQALLSPLEIGTASVTDLDLDSPIVAADISEDNRPNAMPGAFPPHGLVVSWNTNPFELFTTRRTGGWVYPLQSWSYPGGDPPGVDLRFPSSDHAFDGAGGPVERFDYAINVTPGALNQYLRERYLSQQYGLAGVWRPTYADLGARLPNGVDPDTPMRLTGNVLGRYVHRAFRTLGNTELRIRLRPQFMPFLNIPDPLGNVPSGQMPIVYEMSQLQVDFISRAPNDPNPVKLRLLAGFADVDFGLTLDPARGELIPSFGRPAFGLRILRSQLTGCALTPRLLKARVSCEDDLTAAVAALLRPHVEGRLLSMLGQFKVPASFNVQGRAGTPIDAQTTLTWIDAGLITIFTNLVPR